MGELEDVVAELQSIIERMKFSRGTLARGIHTFGEAKDRLVATSVGSVRPEAVQAVRTANTATADLVEGAMLLDQALSDVEAFLAGLVDEGAPASDGPSGSSAPQRAPRKQPGETSARAFAALRDEAEQIRSAWPRSPDTRALTRKAQTRTIAVVEYIDGQGSSRYRAASGTEAVNQRDGTVVPGGSPSPTSPAFLAESPDGKSKRPVDAEVKVMEDLHRNLSASVRGTVRL